MKRLLMALVVCGALSVASSAVAQVYTVYYPSAPVVAPAPVTTYYSPQSAYYAPTTSYYAPTTTYYAPPAVTYYRRPIIGGGIAGWRYNYAPVAPVYRYPVTTAYYYPAW
jgi:hypothetical protein